MVADADALNALGGHAETLFEREGGATVLTPHPGEMARLTGLDITEIEDGDKLAFTAEVDVRPEIDLPEWVGEDVTNDPRYFNSNLVARPYSTW